MDRPFVVRIGVLAGLLAGKQRGAPMSGEISSPASTGAAGPFFEQHVDAYWLVQLLVRAIPPILPDCSVMEVCLQTERLGWETDDFLVVGERGAGRRRSLVGQVKRTFSVSSADKECKRNRTRFLGGFPESRSFQSGHGRLRDCHVAWHEYAFRALFWTIGLSRASRDSADFTNRLATHDAREIFRDRQIAATQLL